MSAQLLKRIVRFHSDVDFGVTTHLAGRRAVVHRLRDEPLRAELLLAHDVLVLVALRVVLCGSQNNG